MRTERLYLINMADSFEQSSSVEVLSVRTFKIETIQAMLDANAFFPQTQMCMRLVAAQRYIEARQMGYAYQSLVITPEDVFANNVEIGRMVTNRLAHEHKKDGRDIRIEKKGNHPGDALNRIGTWYGAVYNDGIDIAEHLQGVALESGLSLGQSLSFVEEALRACMSIFTTETFETVLRYFRETEGRDEALMRTILSRAEQVYAPLLISILNKHGVVRVEYAKEILGKLFFPQKLPSAK